MKKKYWLLASIATSILTGCFSSEVTIEDVCKDTPQLHCEALNMSDGQCRTPRTALIWQRFERFKSPTEANQVQEYKLVAEYRKCLELAAQITPIQQIELKKQRVDALVHSVEELERIVTELQSSEDPSTLYFLWSQTGDHQARRLFLQKEGKPEMDTAELQYALATFYTSQDPEKTLSILNKALSLSNKNNLNPVILKSMASINQGLGNKAQSYLWTMVAKHFGVPVADDVQLKRMFNFTEPEKYQALNELAATIAESIEQGTYSAQMIPKDL